MEPRPPDPDPAATVRELWNRLAQTPWRGFFIASHEGWDDAARWQQQAAIDVAGYLSGIGEAWLRGQHLLEIGCGVGRLARLLAARAHSYTGIDIAEGMLAQARAQGAGIAGARFELGSGTALPPAVCDRSYGLVIAAAVFVHCPLPVIEASVRSAWRQLADPGTFRMQLRVNPADPEQVALAPERFLFPPGANDAFPAVMPPPSPPPEFGSIPGAALAMAQDQAYGGHLFGVAEARERLAAWTGGQVTLLRPAPHLLYAAVSRGGAP